MSKQTKPQSKRLRIDLYIDEDLAKRLYNYVKKTNPRIYGSLTRTLETAIKEFLDRHEAEAE